MKTRTLRWTVVLAAVGLAAIAASDRAVAVKPSSTKAPAAGLKPLDESAWTYEKARHLLMRAGFGGTPQDVEKLHALGLRGAVDYLVDFQSLPEPELPKLETSPYPGREKLEAQYKQGKRSSSLSEDERRQLRRELQRMEFQQFDQIRNDWVSRMILTQRPLEEKLAVFWHGLFACGYRTVRNGYAMQQQNQLLREHAAGNYGELLRAIAHDPAMLRYLDNEKNVKGRPNENLAREIMELFSMGEGQGYTEQDIKEGARALTGNGYGRDWQFSFSSRSHDPEKKTIFGRSGNFDGTDFVNLILEQEAPARFIARRLFVYFAYENPDPAIVDVLARRLRDDKYELRPMLKNLFLSEEFYSDRAVGTQIKSPVQLVVGTMRMLGVRRVPSGRFLAEAMARMEQNLFDPPNVKGWDGGKAWMNTDTLLTRYNFAGVLEKNVGAFVDKYKDKSFKGKKFDSASIRSEPLLDLVDVLKPRKLNSAEAVVDYMARAYLAVPLEAHDRTRMIEFLNAGSSLPPVDEWASQRESINKKLTAALVHLMDTPAYQLD